MKSLLRCHGVHVKGQRPLELRRLQLGGRTGAPACERNSSKAVTLNFTPNHTWLSGFPSILPGLAGFSGKRGNWGWH